MSPPNEPGRWQVVREEHLYSNPWVELRLQTLRLPDGRHYEYTRVDRPRQGVGIFLIDAQGQLLLQREFRPPLDAVVWQVPGGLMDLDEPPLRSAQRELREESGYRAGRWQRLGTVYDNPGLGNACSTLFAAFDPHHAGEATPDDHEVVESHWVTPTWLRQAVRQGEIVDRVVLSGLAFLWNDGLLDSGG